MPSPVARFARRPLPEGEAVRVVNVPAMMIHGNDDGCIGAELLDGMEKLFPKGLKIEVVEGAGHFVHQEKPEVVNEVVLKFFEGVNPRCMRAA